MLKLMGKKIFQFLRPKSLLSKSVFERGYRMLKKYEHSVLIWLSTVICVSGRESWLVHSLVDYYYTTHSRSIINIITELREPHDKVGVCPIHPL